MDQKTVENTLFIGNGFSRSIFRDMPSWDDLFEDVSSAIQDYTILYEAFLLEKKRQGLTEDDVKKGWSKKLGQNFLGKASKTIFVIWNSLDTIWFSIM